MHARVTLATLALFTSAAFAQPDSCADPIVDIGNSDDACRAVDLTLISGFIARRDVMKVADDFAVVADGQITRLCVAGFYVDGPDLETHPDLFEVRFYANDESFSRPDSDAGPADAIATYTGFDDTTSSLDAFDGIIVHTLELDPPLAVSAGTCLWLEVCNEKTGNHWVWAGSPDGNDRMGLDGLFVGFCPPGYGAIEVLDARTLGAPYTNLAFCLDLEQIDDGSGCDIESRVIDNDDCGTYGAPLIIDGPTQIGFTNLLNGHTARGDSTPHCGLVGTGTPDTWHRLVSPIDQRVTLSTDRPATDFDTTLIVYCSPNPDGTECDDLRCVASNDDRPDTTPGTSEVTFSAEANRPYYVRVSGVSNLGGVYELGATGDGDPSAIASPCEPVCDVEPGPTDLIEFPAGCDADSIVATGCFSARSNGDEPLASALGDTLFGRLRAGISPAGGAFFDGDAWTIEHAGGAFTMDIETELVLSLALWTDPEDCRGATRVLSRVVPAGCDTPAVAPTELPAGRYALIVRPGTLAGSVCEDRNTAYRITLSQTCGCEVDGDPSAVDIRDLLAFVSAWIDAEPASDRDGDQSITINDLLLFLTCWFGATGGAGCP